MLFYDNLRRQLLIKILETKISETSVFQKYNVAIKLTYTSKKYPTISTTKTNDIYKYTCSVKQSISYIRETACQMFRQIADHKGTDKTSSIFEHLFDCKHFQNSDITSNFKVLNAID